MRYLLLALLAAVAYALFRTVTKPRSDAPTMRRENDAHGLERKEVARSLPVVAIGGRSYRLVDGRCICFRLPSFRPGAARWELLQRAGTEAPPFPAGWQLVLRESELPPELQAELLRITGEWTEGYLELEGDEQGVMAFTDETRGQAGLWQINGYLRALVDGAR